MVKTQIEARGILEPRLLMAMRRIDRVHFIPGSAARHAYDDGPQSIGHDQTISQPFIVALMTDLLGLEDGESVLEIGVGSGYQTAILLAMGARVFGVERVAALAETARGNIAKALGESALDRFQLVIDDGSLGFPLPPARERDAFDAILVAAAAPAIPPPLIRQLKPGGRLVIPVGDRFVQDLVLARKNSDGSLEERIVDGVRFVPLVGRHGFAE